MAVGVLPLPLVLVALDGNSCWLTLVPIGRNFEGGIGVSNCGAVDTYSVAFSKVPFWEPLWRAPCWAPLLEQKMINYMAQ
jgi:hypothetical protein